MKSNHFHIFLLLVCAFLWGTTFVAQSIGAGYVEAFTYLAGRSWIAIVFLSGVIPVLDRMNDRKGKYNKRPRNAYQYKYLAAAGAICGTVLCLASASQQAGMATTSAGKASFLTAMYVVIVPVISIFLKKRPPAQIWVCVLISVFGMMLLCLGKSFLNGEALSIESGDALIIVCAFLFAAQVICVAIFIPYVDGVRLSRMQFLVTAVESTILMLIFEHPELQNILKALPAILYAGIFSSGVAFTLQIVAQEDVNPTVATLVMSMESVFGAVSGWIILGERMLPVEIIGAVCVFSAVILAQIPLPERKKAAG